MSTPDPTPKPEPRPLPEPSRAGRQADSRVVRSKEAVIRTTFDLLTEGGLDGLSVDEVARRSGVAKTTIYRHWPTKSDLVIDACSRIVTEEATPDTGTLDGDLTELLTNLAERLRTARWSSIVPSIIDAAERDPRLAEVHSRIQRGHAAPLRAVLERAARRGEIPSDVASADSVAALLGPLFYRRWFSREPLDGSFVETIVLGAVRRMTAP